MERVVDDMLVSTPGRYNLCGAAVRRAYLDAFEETWLDSLYGGNLAYAKEVACEAADAAWQHEDDLVASVSS